MSVNVFGSAPAGSNGLEAFADKGFDGDDFRLVEHVGKSAIFTVHGPKNVNTRNGAKDAVQVDVVVLDGDKGQKFDNVLIFNQVPVDQLRGLSGRTTVAAITTYETKSGGQAPKLDAPSESDLAAAKKYLDN